MRENLVSNSVVKTVFVWKFLCFARFTWKNVAMHDENETWCTACFCVSNDFDSPCLLSLLHVKWVKNKQQMGIFRFVGFLTGLFWFLKNKALTLVFCFVVVFFWKKMWFGLGNPLCASKTNKTQKSPGHARVTRRANYISGTAGLQHVYSFGVPTSAPTTTTGLSRRCCQVQIQHSSNSFCGNRMLKSGVWHLCQLIKWELATHHTLHIFAACQSRYFFCRLFATAREKLWRPRRFF